MFNACGNMATGTGTQRAAIWMKTGLVSHGACNAFHIHDNFFDLSVGRGIWFDGSGLAANGYCFISGNHFEGHDTPTDTGCWAAIWADSLEVTSINTISS